MPTLSLNDVVRVVINMSPRAAVRPGFNLGLIVGDSGVISEEERIRIYNADTALQAMAEDGFDLESPEYQAVNLYLQAQPQPTRVAVGVQGAEETPLEAVMACRSANREWHGVHVCDADKEDILAVAGFVETVSPSAALFYSTQDEDVLTAAEGSIFKAMAALNYLRSWGMYHHEHPYAAAGAMGYAYGANTGTANSAYTLALKRIPVLTTVPINDTELANIKDNNGNVYINRGATYDLLEDGNMADGTPFDEVINLDMLANDVQMSILDLLVSRPKVPQTDAGVTDIISAIIPDFDNAVNRGFLAPGQWNGPSILELETGDTLPNGYFIQAEPVASQSRADREARKAPPLYAAVKFAGAIQEVLFQIDVDR